jgi:hypothetical protein
MHTKKLDMERLRDHVYEFDNLVIGGTLQAVLFAYSKSLPLLFIKAKVPLMFEQTECLLFKGSCKTDLWHRLVAILSLGGLIPFSSKINTLRITGKNHAEAYSDNRRFLIKFNKLSIFDEEGIAGLEPPVFTANKRYKVYDWLTNRGMSKHDLEEIQSDDLFVKKVLFYKSTRKGAQRTTKDILAVSELSEEQFFNLEYSENFARLKAIRMMKDAGLRGYSNGYSKIKKALQYYAIAVEHDKREFQILGRDVYKSSATLEHHIIGEKEIEQVVLATHLEVIDKQL